MSTKMIEIPIKMENTIIKYHIMKWAVVIKLFWNKHKQKITLQTEERTQCAWYIIENNSKNKKQSPSYKLHALESRANIQRSWSCG